MKLRHSLFWILGVFLIVASLTTPNVATAIPARSLILYDSSPALPYNKLGHAYAIMLRNLLGHFATQVDIRPIEGYRAGDMTPYQCIFYLGALYDNAIPRAFLTDVTQTSQTVVWFKYNLWQLAWDSTFNFVSQRGFSFSGLRGLDGTPSASTPNPGFFDTVLYKGQSLAKFYHFDATTGSIQADPDVGVTQIVDATKAQAITLPCEIARVRPRSKCRTLCARAISGMSPTCRFPTLGRVTAIWLSVTCCMTSCRVKSRRCIAPWCAWKMSRPSLCLPPCRP